MRPAPVGPLVRERIGALAAEIEVGRQLMVHCAEYATGGTTPPENGVIGIDINETQRNLIAQRGLGLPR